MKDDFYNNYEKEINSFIDLAIKEDLGDVDHSSKATLSNKLEKKSTLIIKENCIIAGIELSKSIFKKHDKSLKFTCIFKDGQEIESGTEVFIVEGKGYSILAMERLVLNCIQRMSGIATLTNKFNKIISHTDCKLLDTRKTTPNFRYPEKWAVVIGGGYNHRMGLYDALMIKDNHIDFCGGINFALDKTKKYLSGLKRKYDVIVETRNLKEVKEVLNYSFVNRILLDNMDIPSLIGAVSLVDNKIPTEASGNITESNILSVAETGVNYISLGCLTYSAKPIDISLQACE